MSSLLERVNLSFVVAQALSQLERELKEGDAQVSVVEPLPVVQGNRTTLLQVVVNLLSNAIKFVDPGIQPQVRISGETEREFVRLWVEDNGSVFPARSDRKFSEFLSDCTVRKLTPVLASVWQLSAKQ